MIFDHLNSDELIERVSSYTNQQCVLSLHADQGHSCSAGAGSYDLRYDPNSSENLYAILLFAKFSYLGSLTTGLATRFSTDKLDVGQNGNCMFSTSSPNDRSLYRGDASAWWEQGQLSSEARINHVCVWLSIAKNATDDYFLGISVIMSETLPNDTNYIRWHVPDNSIITLKAAAVDQLDFKGSLGLSPHYDSAPILIRIDDPYALAGPGLIVMKKMIDWHEKYHEGYEEGLTEGTRTGYEEGMSAGQQLEREKWLKTKIALHNPCGDSITQGDLRTLMADGTIQKLV